ncbi:TetR/AcrR family transcriptional regulator [Psychrobacillus sp. FSL K6-4615]|uniref:TetR/AcrR family transcriptional regulator n=1 Tax=Psychrobacillus sp. FSL K6-4615 TaxID=2921551 RepID=UPI0030F50422
MIKNNKWQLKLEDLNNRIYKEKSKTYDIIITIFKKLVTEKDFEKISVAEISTVAGISRKTFYQYFKDKNDIVDHIVFLNIIQPMTQLFKLSKSFEFPSVTIISWLYEQFYEDRLFYTRVSLFTGQNSFLDLILDHTSDMISERVGNLDIPDHAKEYSIYFYAASHTMILKKWINDGMIIHPKEMALMYEKWTIPAFNHLY